MIIKDKEYFTFRCIDREKLELQELDIVIVCD